MAPLPWLPKEVVDTSADWDFQSTVASAFDQLRDAGSAIMRPFSEQVATQPAPSMPQPAPTPAVKPFSIGTPADWGFGQKPEAPKTSPTTTSGLFQLPGLETFLPTAGSGDGGRVATMRSASPQTGYATATRAGAGEIENYIRQAAAARGIDPDIAVRVAESEGGLTDPVRQSDVINERTGQREQSYGPFQLYLGGGLGNEAMAQGIDPRNPAHWQRGVDFALDAVARGGWGPFHGAARVGIGPRQGIGQERAAPAPSPSPTGQQAPAWGTYTPETLTPNQFTEGQAQGLTPAEAIAVCGPAAATAFARANGRTPTLREAKELAASLGLWDADVGMHGPAAQVQLLERMGVPSTLAQGTDWASVRGEVEAGRPVIIDTPQHYYVATGYDPRTGEFEFGASAGVLLRSGGKTRWRPEELPGLGMGAPRATIYFGGRGR